MTVNASSIEVGKCYVTGYSELRRVVDADMAEVRYEVIGSPRPTETARFVCISREKFASEVDREVVCPE